MLNIESISIFLLTNNHKKTYRSYLNNIRILRTTGHVGCVGCYGLTCRYYDFLRDEKTCLYYLLLSIAKCAIEHLPVNCILLGRILSTYRLI